MTSRFQHPTPSSAAAVAAALGAAIAAFVSGCCGGAPTHGCMFTESSKDAGSDSSTDAGESCGLETCVPGQTYCCLDTDPISLMCIPIGQVCKGMSAMCAGDQDCTPGAGLHCCGQLDTGMIQCQADCSGDITDNTVRICRTSAECPATHPYCGQITVSQIPVYACQAPPSR
jgi:hypothetical protein